MKLRDRIGSRLQELAGLSKRREEKEAQDRGEFSNLKGEGKPQKLEDNPFEDPEMRLVHKILANAGYCPPWLELLKGIDSDVASAEAAWKDYEHFRRRQMNDVSRGTVLRFAETIGEVDAARNRALERLRKRWEDINKRVEYLNATVPSEAFTRTPINIDKRTREFERHFPLISGTLSSQR